MASHEEELLELLASLTHRPYDFVVAMFPWGEAGTELEKRAGPDKWQAEELLRIQAALLAKEVTPGEAVTALLKIAIRSGHGVGKTAFLSWVAWWALSTVTDTRGRLTANTEKQLRTILWSELAKWHRLFIARDLFKVTATSIYSADPEHEKNWRLDAIPWSEDNPEAFAGLHNFGKRIIIIMDEASGIANNIWEVVDGATTDTDTEILWIATSNPTKNFGRYHDCFNEGSGWLTRQVDARDSAFSNKETIEAWRVAWGEDSDFFRVRVRGDFPNSSELQLIPVEAVALARKRDAVSYPVDSCILAVDIARFGSNESVAQVRRGNDARSVPVQRWRGLSTVETAHRINGLIEQHEPDAIFVDEGGVGGGVIDYLRAHFGRQISGVNFGGSAHSRPNGVLVGNKRAEMYVALREALRSGLAIADSDDLQEQCVSIEYHFNKKTEIMLMSKEDMRMVGKPSPDWADALAMTFAFPVSKRNFRRVFTAKTDYDPLSIEAHLAAANEDYQKWA